ncbi:hypothetical protein DTO169E5_4445 [Paecilomyces variotii]|nr:hypothetical protein DTO169E5_4445 [Paecilomyces variotii]
MDPANQLDLEGPPRKKMRKGTRSCIECRRRKIRCTFDPERHNVCNECYARGSVCIDQEHGSLPPRSTGGEQRYSLRERVAQLDTVVAGILTQLEGRQSSVPLAHSAQSFSENERAARAQRSTSHDICPTPTVSSVSSSYDQLETANAPVLQLFNNYVVSREDPPSGDDSKAVPQDMSPKALSARNALISLLPPNPDIDRILNGTIKWWAYWQTRFPEICDNCRRSLTTGVRHCDIPASPAEVAKMLICVVLSIDQLPLDFDYSALQRPFDPKKYTDRCISEIYRLIVHDDDFAATFPGIECQMLISKYHTNVGRPRKAWLACRRAIEFAQLTGLHLLTAKPPRPGDELYDRRLRLWINLVSTDRFLSLILGLPYSVSDDAYSPQVKLCLNGQLTGFERYVARIGVFMGQVIDRNQRPGEMSLPETLRMDQELEELAKEMPSSWWDPNAGDQYTVQENCDRLMSLFYHSFLRSLLHLPFMLKSNTDRRCKYCHDAALESSRNGLVAYTDLRALAGINPYICKVLDFFAFTLGMLLVVHLLGYSEELENYSRMQDEKDWQLVNKTTESLRRAAAESGGTVAAQSANILGTICDNCSSGDSCPGSTSGSRSCKITVPFFGTITVAPGKKFSAQRITQCSPQTSNYSQVSSQKGNQLYTPPQSNPTAVSSTQPTPIPEGGYPDESWIQLQNVVALPYTGLDPNGLHNSFEDPGLGMWSNPLVGLDLDQGWNLNWTEDGNAVIE